MLANASKSVWGPNFGHSFSPTTFSWLAQQFAMQTLHNAIDSTDELEFKVHSEHRRIVIAEQSIPNSKK